MKIAKWKIDKVASIMVGDLRKEAQEASKAVTAMLEELVKKSAPPEIMSCFLNEKTRAYVKKAQTFYIDLTGLQYSSYYLLDAPFYTGDSTIGSDHPFIAYIEPLEVAYQKKSEKVRVTGEKIKCALGSIGTDTKMKKEFPEAYSILMAEVEGVPVSEDDNCVDVEDLRNELKSHEKQNN